MRSQVMALRFDPDASALMAAELARDNADQLRGVLGREPDPAELYLAHFLGAGGARTFLTAMQQDAGQSAAALLPQPAAANRAIFYDNGRARSVGEVMDLIRGKVGSAMQGGGYEPGNPPAYGAFQVAAAGRSAMSPARLGEASRPSMADTLQATFGAAGQMSGKAGERVGRAYAALRTFNL
jgi:hypothetical protein